jgi:hypothetical protein
MNADETLQKAYAAFNARDIGAALELMSPGVAWPNGMEGGVAHGQDAVREYWTRQWEMIDPIVMPVSIRHEPDGCYTVEVHQLVKDLTGNVLVDRIVHHRYRLEHGLIESMEIPK